MGAHKVSVKAAWLMGMLPLPSKRKRNPEFTTDEIKTAALLVTEGASECRRGGKYKYLYPSLEIAMCDREALEPASRVFKTKIGKARSARVVCPPELFPLDGRGKWRIVKTGLPAHRLIQHLDPLLTTYFKKKWKQTLEKCPPKRPYA